MKTFKEYVVMREDEAPPVGVDPDMWAAASERMRNYLRTQAQGAVPQAPQAIPQQPVTYRAARALGTRSSLGGPIQGQTGQGLESIPAGGRVPSHLVAQIPSGDIAPGWETATKFYKGRDGRIYKK